MRLRVGERELFRPPSSGISNMPSLLSIEWRRRKIFSYDLVRLISFDRGALTYPSQKIALRPDIIANTKVACNTL